MSAIFAFDKALHFGASSDEIMIQRLPHRFRLHHLTFLHSLGQKRTFPHEIKQRAKHMNHELLASIVSFEEDDAMVVFAFSANEGESAEYLMLQYPLQMDEQDRRLRLDGLYIERNDQGFGCYQGVESIRRVGDRIEIDLNAEGKRRLKVERMVIAPVHWSPAIDQGLSRLAELSRGEYNVKVQ